VSLRRLPAAIAAAFTIITFRIELPFSAWHNLNVASLFCALAYMAALYGFAFTNAHHNDPALWSDRAGCIALMQCTFIVALSGKNNVISWLTGIGHEKLNVMHRIAGRSVLVLVWAHGFGRIKIRLAGGDSLSNSAHLLGLVSGVTYFYIVLFSLRPIRRISYKFFLPMHIFLVLVTLITAYFHSYNVKSYLYPAFAMWCFDRACRIARIIISNRLWNSVLFWRRNDSQEARVERLGLDTVRITMRRNMSWTAGQHVYLSIPSLSPLPTEVHPFTISTHPHEQQINGLDREIVCVIRPKLGFTRKLFELVEDGRPRTINVHVDGAYGSPPSLTSYSTVVLVAGGTGITYLMPLFLDLIHNAKKNSSAVRRIVFIWSVKRSAHLNWFSGQIHTAIATAPPELQIDFRKYISRAVRDRSGQLELAAWKAGAALGRPDIFGMISDEISAASGPVSVGVSGPSGMENQARRALSCWTTVGPSAVLRGAPVVHAHFETSRNL